MVNTIKAAKAADNSARALSRAIQYTGVDGRTYITEPSLPSTAPRFSDLYKKFGHGFPSLIELYRCDHYLSGKGLYYKSYVPAKEKALFIEELGLSFSQIMQRYTASEDVVWEHFQQKYPDAIARERITSYGELVYRSKHRR